MKIRKRFDPRRKQLIVEQLEGRDLLAASLGFTPLPSTAPVGGLPETAPFALPAGFTQAVVETQSTLGPGESMPVGNDGGSWPDMLTLNENGEQAGRYLFRAHELFSSLGGNAGVSRTDLATGETVTILQRADYDAMDPAFWSPWGTLIIGEESAGAGTIPDPDVSNALNGLVYEVLNPLEADPASIVVVPRPGLGSQAHEGIQFDAAGNVYTIDELNGGGIYKFVPTNFGDMGAGQLFVLRDLDLNGGTDAGDNGVNDLGLAEWVPLNDVNGQPIAGVTDPIVDGRTAANDVNSTNYLRPEDLQMSRVANGNEVLYVATTTDHRVLSIEFTAAGPMVRTFIDRTTPVDSAAGTAVGTNLTAPDNLAIDGEGRIYVVEDQTPGDIWASVDADNNGVAEFIGRFASLTTAGAEPTGLYFNPFNPNEAFVNVQHSTSDNDGTFVIHRTAAAANAKLVNGVLAVNGTAGNDKLRVDRVGTNLLARLGNRVLGSFPEAQVLSILVNAGAGNDEVRIQRSLTIGATIFGGAGHDKLYGGSGNDVLSGGDGNDTISGGDGDDEIFGLAGRDLLLGDGGHDKIWGGLDHDIIFGGDGDDELDGGDGRDLLYGGRGLDFLFNGEVNAH